MVFTVQIVFKRAGVMPSLPINLHLKGRMIGDSLPNSLFCLLLVWCATVPAERERESIHARHPSRHVVREARVRQKRVFLNGGHECELRLAAFADDTISAANATALVLIE